MHTHFTTGEPCNCTWTKHLGWEPLPKTAEYFEGNPHITIKQGPRTYPTHPGTVVDWRKLEDEYPNEGMHGTGDLPYFWDLKKNIVHIGPQDWYHDALAEEMAKTEHGHPYYSDLNSVTPQWASGRTGMWRAIHKPVFDALSAHGVDTDSDWGSMFKQANTPTVVQSVTPGSLFEDKDIFSAPDRTGTRPIVYHRPTNTIYMGLRDQHHADVIKEHGLDHTAMGSDPYFVSVDDDPYEWTSDSVHLDHMKDFNYATMEPKHGGGVGLRTWGQFPRHVRKHLENEGWIEPNPYESWEDMFHRE